MTAFTIYILYTIGIIISWIIFYYVVKAAVKNGIREASTEKILPTYFKDSKPEKPANSEQIKLQQRYDMGEITFEVYQAKWNKLNT